MGIAMLRKYGAIAFARIVAWWLPPRTQATLRKCKLFIKWATEKKYIMAGNGISEYPPDLLAEIEADQRRARDVLLQL